MPAFPEVTPEQLAETDAVLAALTTRGHLEHKGMGALHGGVSVVDKIGRGTTPGVRPPKVRYSHEAMADLILENPWISQGELAEYFGYSDGWISTIVQSDAFQSHLEARRAEIIDPELRANLQQRFQALTAQSLKVLHAKLSKPAEQVSDQLALRAAELGAKALGFGASAPPAPVATNPAHLNELADRLIALQKRARTDFVDVPSREISPDA